MARALRGQLTATVHHGQDDGPAAAELLPVLEDTAGRVLFLRPAPQDRRRQAR
ncbi:hypothetical protein ACWEF9_17945 [Streptomyces sp. NPDC004980]